MATLKHFNLGILTFLILQAVNYGFTKKKPKIFVVGDSISMHYGSYLKKHLDGLFIYDRKGGSEIAENLDNPAGANGGDSFMVLTYLNELKGNQEFTTDYFLINCGLHDIKRNYPTEDLQINIESYIGNLKKIIQICKTLEAKLIWVNITPVVDSIHNAKISFKRYNKDVIEYNVASKALMQKMGVPIIDLYSFTFPYIPNGYIDHVHYSSDVREKQAKFISKQLIKISKTY